MHDEFDLSTEWSDTVMKLVEEKQAASSVDKQTKDLEPLAEQLKPTYRYKRGHKR